MNETLLKLEDINTFIKAFAYWIQIRLQEIQIWHNKSTNQFQKSESLYDNGDEIANKFINYKTEHEMQVKLAKKFAQRILQIFQFFKTKSKNQNLLQIIETKLTNKLEFLASQIPLNVGQIFYICQALMKKGAMLRNNFQRSQTSSKLHNRQKAIKSMRRTFTNKLIKVQTVSICQQHPSYSLMPMGQLQNDLKVNKSTTSQIRPCGRSKFNRPSSVASIGKRWVNSSVHKKQPIFIKQNNSKQVQIERLYVGMSLDKNYINKSIQRSEFMMKDSLKRNSKLIVKLTHINKRVKTQSDQYPQVEFKAHTNILGEWNSKISKLNVCTSSGIKSYINRKRKYNLNFKLKYCKLSKKQIQAKQNCPEYQLIS